MVFPPFLFPSPSSPKAFNGRVNIQRAKQRGDSHLALPGDIDGGDLSTGVVLIQSVIHMPSGDQNQ